MPRLLVCQHVPYEILGTLNPLLKSAGFRIRYVNFGRHPDAEPSLDGYQGLVVLGGPMSVNDTDRHPHLTTELKLIEQAMNRGIPVLGICLGAQLIAKTLGARVYANDEKEIGWYDVSPTEMARGDPLAAHLEESEKLFQWHGDTFDIPKGAVHLASSTLCASQAFRYGPNAYALQFHLEVDEPMIERWLTVPTHVKEIESLGGKIDPQTIRRETPGYIQRLKELSDRTFGEFINLFGFEKTRRRLGSR
ncbi:MAG: glutamine amidotransferase-related protein [Candidatus Binatia bacterium]